MNFTIYFYMIYYLMTCSYTWATGGTSRDGSRDEKKSRDFSPGISGLPNLVPPGFLQKSRYFSKIPGNFPTGFFEIPVLSQNPGTNPAGFLKIPGPELEKVRDSTLFGRVPGFDGILPSGPELFFLIKIVFFCVKSK